MASTKTLSRRSLKLRCKLQAMAPNQSLHGTALYAAHEFQRYASQIQADAVTSRGALVC